jgi:hypothetical protein
MSSGQFNIQKAKRLEFVTFGGLNLNKQKGFGKHSTFHSPPAVSGIYAFVWPLIEPFLLGGSEFVDPKKRGKGQRQRIVYVRDKDGNVVSNKHPDYEKVSCQSTWTLQKKKWSGDEENDDAEWWLYRNAYRKKFTYSGNIWHHLEVPEWTVLDRKKEWVKTDMETFIRALKAELHRCKVQSQKSWNSKIPSNNLRFISKDHLEVFISDKI